MKDHFAMFAAYNAWANRTLYAAASELTEDELVADKGAFFGSVLRTLNHLLVADRVWMHRMSGEGMLPTALDQLLYPRFPDLKEAREAEDARIIAFIDGLDEARLSGSISFTPVGKTEPVISQRLHSTLSHVFNHQTHHRGQCHAILTALGKPSLTLDLVYYLRQQGQQWL
jgi:uncharacterized damage-inducible protein DinB